MRALVLLTLFSIAVAKPGGLFSGWGDPHGVPSVSYVQQPVAVAQPVVAQHYVAQPVVHAAPAIAIAKPAATSYSSFQRVIHPVAQPVVHAAPVISQPVVHAPVVSQPIVQVAQPVVHAAPVIQQPIVHSYAQPVVSKVVSVGSYGGYASGYGHGW